jgi:hypothetical protein
MLGLVVVRIEEHLYDRLGKVSQELLLQDISLQELSRYKITEEILDLIVIEHILSRLELLVLP